MEEFEFNIGDILIAKHTFENLKIFKGKPYTIVKLSERLVTIKDDEMEKPLGFFKNNISNTFDINLNKDS